MKTLINIHDNHLGKFNTSTGAEVDFENPTGDTIHIEDIAHALSNICRFGGHCFPFYSVGQHSLIVMALAPQPLKLAALLHDAPEAYVGDIIKPFKNLLGWAYEAYESAFETVIGNKFGIDYNDLAAVKPYDKLALEIEHEALTQGNYARLITVMGQNGLLKNDWAWNPPYAEEQFMQAFEALYKPELIYSEHQ